MTFSAQDKYLRKRARQCGMLLRKLPRKPAWNLYKNPYGQNKGRRVTWGGNEELLRYLDAEMAAQGMGRLF